MSKVIAGMELKKGEVLVDYNEYVFLTCSGFELKRRKWINSNTCYYIFDETPELNEKLSKLHETLSERGEFFTKK